MTVINWFRCTGCGSVNQTDKALDAASTFLCEACEAKGIALQNAQEQYGVPDYIRDLLQELLEAVIAVGVGERNTLDKAVAWYKTLGNEDMVRLLQANRDLIHKVEWDTEWGLIGIKLEASGSE